MELGHLRLRDAAARKRERRRRAQLGALMDPQRQPHRLSAIATSEETRGSETPTTGHRATTALRCSSTMAGMFTCELGNTLDPSVIRHSRRMVHDDPVQAVEVQAEEPLSTEQDVPSSETESRRAQLGALIAGYHRCAAIATTEESRRGLKTLMMPCRHTTTTLHSSSTTVAGKFMEEARDMLEDMFDPRVFHHSRGDLEDASILLETVTSQDASRPEILMTSRQTTPLLFSSPVVVKFRDECNISDPRLIRRVHDPLEDARNLLQFKGPLSSSAENARSGSHKFNPESQQGADCKVGTVDSLLIPIFVRHCCGELTLRVRLGQSSQQLMDLYAQKTKTKLESQYFVYNRKRLEPDHTLLFYGLKPDTTVHVCTRLLGGQDYPNLTEYISDNKKKFIEHVRLPDGQISIQMTTIGCQFVSSWMRCLTKAFVGQRSWNGVFTSDNFKFADGHVRAKKKPRKIVPNSGPQSVGNDLVKFADLVEDILSSDMQNTVSKYPAYLKSCTQTIRRFVTLYRITNAISDEDKLFLETLVCCMTSYARQRLIIELYRRYEGADQSETSIWKNAIDGASIPTDWLTTLNDTAMFKDLIMSSTKKGISYSNNIGAFTLLKDVVLHSTDKKAKALKLCDDSIELMIPAYLEDFLPSIIQNLIYGKVDIIRAELFQAVRCACEMCDSSD